MSGGPALSAVAASAGVGPVEVALAMIAALGFSAQWLAWRLKIPSILLLLGFGFAVGPGWAAMPWSAGPLLDADAVFGGSLLPLVGLCVGLILYEGGLTLRVKEIRGVGRTVAMLVTLGAAVTWLLATYLGVWLLGLPLSLAVLLGAVLIVTGPTVIIPLLGHIRPAGQVGPVLRWEGIVIDPIGALAAVLVLEVIQIGNPSQAMGEVALAVARTVVVGGGLGVLAAAVIVGLTERFWVPESLQNPMSLGLVVIVFIGSDALQPESGLLASTVMGIALANQRRVDIRHIVEFKENLRVLIIGALFIVLASRVRVEDLRSLGGWQVALFVAALIGVVRPASVLASTLRTRLSGREKALMCLMAPRGIVAAAVSSVFALALEKSGAVEEPSRLVALTFAVIVGTVVFYAVVAPIAAKRLGVSDQDPQGVLIVGASPLARSMAGALAKLKVKVALVDTNRGNVTAARMAGLDARYGNVLEDQFFEDLDLRGVGRAMAMTPNAEVNTLALQRFERVLGKANVYRIPVRDRVAKGEGEARARAQTEHGRRLFGKGVDLSGLEQRVAEGSILRSTTLSEGFPMSAYETLYGLGAVILFMKRRDGSLVIATDGKRLSGEAGDTIVALVDSEMLLMPVEGDGQENNDEAAS